MKIWPIITLAGLIWGSFYADGQNTGRESAPHSRHHGLTELDAELAADMKAFDQPHRPVTMAYREFFAKLLADEHDWSTPESKATAEVADDNPDDGEDPGKKLFWHSVFPNSPAVPFPGWGDPNPIANPDTVSPPFQGSRDVGFEIIFINDEPPRNEGPDQTSVARASSHIMTVSEGFSPAALKAINDLTTAPLPPQCTPGSADLSCLITVACASAQIIVKGMCDDKDADKPPLPLDPGNPLTPPIGTPDPPPFVGGGGNGSGMGGGIGGGHSVGAVPEPSTWAMIISGFALMGALAWRRAYGRSSSASSSSS